MFVRYLTTRILCFSSQSYPITAKVCAPSVMPACYVDTSLDTDCGIIAEHSTASDFIDRALFSYERAFVGAFTFTGGGNRLDFDRVENRPFFLALHRQIMCASQLPLPLHLLPAPDIAVCLGSNAVILVTSNAAVPSAPRSNLPVFYTLSIHGAIHTAHFFILTS